jgi:hypothetical protein
LRGLEPDTPSEERFAMLEREVVLMRIFGVPRDLLFELWVDPR